MKFRAFSCFSFCMIAGSANAQSSVTLYGIADSGLVFTSNAKGNKLISLGSGNEITNRWGMTGNEDLGDGLAAIFTLEAGYNIANGKIYQNGTEFGSKAFVGLTSRYGTVTLGRQISDTYNAVGFMEAGGDWAAAGIGFGAHPGDADNLDTSNRINNAIRYSSRTVRGITFSGVYSFGGQQGAFSKNAIWSVAVTYAGGPVQLGAVYLFAKEPNYSFWGDKANDSTTASNIPSPVINGYASAGSEQIVAAAGSYSFGPATAGLVYSNTQFQQLGAVAVAGEPAAARSYTGSAALNTGEANLKFRLNPSFLLAASYSFTINSGANSFGSGRYQQVDVGAIYSLSKRTSLYAVGVWQRAAGKDSTGGRAVAAITGTTASSNDHQVVATLGMLHKF